MATSEENQKEDGTQEYTPLTEQAEETVEKNLFRVKGHNFRLYTFKQPTYCALCRKFLWGLVKQGHSCKECRMAVHRRCYANVFGKCRTKEETDDNENQNDDDPSKPHTFEVYSFKTPTYCDHCGSMIYGLCSQGLKCKECKTNVHHRCKTRATHVCGIDQKAEILKLKEKIPTVADENDEDKKEVDGDENKKEEDEGEKGKEEEEQPAKDEDKEEKAEDQQEAEKKEEGKDEAQGEEKTDEAQCKEQETEKSGDDAGETKEDETPVADEDAEAKADEGEAKGDDDKKDDGDGNGEE
ncbi:uncharacterized protein [Apostichopus japonicus]|uniref:uncharacterized protein n=1 Tax=Stichopus japonicus TaxID=307972 RepID=UPI003AB6EC95